MDPNFFKEKKGPNVCFYNFLDFAFYATLFFALAAVMSMLGCGQIAALNWHRANIDGVECIVSSGHEGISCDWEHASKRM